MPEKALARPEPAFRVEIPYHAMLVPFPVPFNLLTWMLDILYAMTAQYVKPSFLTSRFSSPATLIYISQLGYFSLCASIVTMVPAILTGNLELLQIINKQGGLKPKNAKTIPAKVQVALIHGTVNQLVFVVSLFSWYMRRNTDANPNPGTPPKTLNLVISLCCIPFAIGSLRLGWSLVYNFGSGLKLGRKVVNELNMEAKPESDKTN